MNLRPLGHRVLIQPDAAPDETASGLILPQDRDHIPMSGTVVALGDGPARDQRIRSRSVSRCLSIVQELAESFPNSLEFTNALRDELGRYKAQTEHYDGGIAVGDRVAYAADTGLLLTEDGQPYIVLNEEDVVVLVADETVAA